MKKLTKIALWGAWHVHAPQYLREAIGAGATVVGVFDENEAWKNDLAEKFGVPAFDTAGELLKSDAEGVIVCTATADHVKVMPAIAAAGKAVFTEKVLALTEADALAVKAAVEKTGVRFVISFPDLYAGDVKAIRQILDAGEIGQVNYYRFRNCHNGSTGRWLPPHFYDLADCGGGAMIDLGAHGMYLTRALFGMPEAYRSSFTHTYRAGENTFATDAAVEDNAVTVMTFESGAIAVNETGFVTVDCPKNIEIGGTRGYIRCMSHKVSKCTHDTEHKWVEVPNEEPDPSPLLQFLTGDLLPGCGIDDAVDLTRMMCGAYQNR